MRLISKPEIVEALKALGICPGDIVHVQSDLRSIGPVDAPLTRDGQCGFYLEALHQVIGSEGTITCCTAFEDYGRFGTPFIREESPSRTDMLSEFLRLQPGAIRSIHPIVSVTAQGKKADEICGGNHFNGFGYSSPWGRLHRANAKILTLGLGSNQGGTTFFHYVENLYGVPYTYTKIFQSHVISMGEKLKGPFTMAVRYLDFDIENTPIRVKNTMVKNKSATEVKTGRSLSWCAPAKEIAAQMICLLDSDRWVMLERQPAFRPGVLPMDGKTGDPVKSYDLGNSKGAK